MSFRICTSLQNGLFSNFGMLRFQIMKYTVSPTPGKKFTNSGVTNVGVTKNRRNIFVFSRRRQTDLGRRNHVKFHTDVWNGSEIIHSKTKFSSWVLHPIPLHAGGHELGLIAKLTPFEVPAFMNFHRELTRISCCTSLKWAPFTYLPLPNPNKFMIINP